MAPWSSARNGTCAALAVPATAASAQHCSITAAAIAKKKNREQHREAAR
jgi:hypothetical protein